MSLPVPAFDESTLTALIDAAQATSPSVSEIATLARHLAESGVTLTWPGSLDTADIASTGGPGSLSTLLTPLALAAAGCSVVKLAVPGRPAGAIDAMATIPGYRSRLSVDDVKAVVATCGFAHFLADERFAPLDAQLFALRKRVGAVAVPALAIASLLSKKLAVGIRKVGLDVRVGRHGNFGATRYEARANAQLFCSVANVLGIAAVAFLSPEDDVPQPWIGRGESLCALASALGLRDLEDQWLDDHVTDCLQMAETIAVARRPLSFRDVLAAHLNAQGASTDAFLSRVDEVQGTARRPVHVRTAGTLEVDLGRIRDVIVKAQSDDGSSFGDPLGVRLLVRPGQSVNPGDVVATIRGSDQLTYEEIAGALSVSGRTAPPLTSIEVVHA
jgi:thymidine phosphorylase